MVAAFLMGTKKLYDFVDDNPDVLMRTVDYVNNPAVICPESESGVHQLLPTGGFQRPGELRVHGHQAVLRRSAVSWTMSAARPCVPTAKSILAMPSTAKHGTSVPDRSGV